MNFSGALECKYWRKKYLNLDHLFCKRIKKRQTSSLFDVITRHSTVSDDKINATLPVAEKHLGRFLKVAKAFFVRQLKKQQERQTKEESLDSKIKHFR